MGMIGTLIGLVLMLKIWETPSQWSCDGCCIVDNALRSVCCKRAFAPIVGKLSTILYEIVYREIVLEGLRGIARSESPRNIQDQMAAALPPKLQSKFELAA